MSPLEYLVAGAAVAYSYWLWIHDCKAVVRAWRRRPEDPLPVWADRLEVDPRRLVQHGPQMPTAIHLRGEYDTLFCDGPGTESWPTLSVALV